MLNPTQLDSIRDWVCAGALRAEESMRVSLISDVGLEIRDISCTRLCDLPERLQCFEGDCVAGAVARFSGTISGSVLVAMEPGHALCWARSRMDGGDPIQDFLDLAFEIQSQLVTSIGQGMGAHVELSSPHLCEDSVPAILFGTHAPSDTAVLCLQAKAVAGNDVIPFGVYVMIDPKTLGFGLSH